MRRWDCLWNLLMMCAWTRDVVYVSEMFVSSLPLCELEETFQIPGYTDSYAFTRASIVHTI